MRADQEAFLVDQIFSLTLMGTAQRGKLYRKESSEPSRESFRQALRAELAKYAIQYKKRVSSDRHCANISALSDDLSALHKDALTCGRFRIGSAQKALNLYLKYLWCLDRIKPPPHCPFDYGILLKVPNCEDVKWTELDCIARYKEIVREAELVAKSKNLTLAEWELREWQAGQMTPIPVTH